MKEEMIEIAVDMDVYKAIEARRKSFRQSQNDILKQTLGLVSVAPVGSGVISSDAKVARSTTRARATGSYDFDLLGQAYSEPSLKAAYVRCLTVLSNRNAQFLSALAKLELRARRIVATDPNKLYKNSPHLAEAYAEKLTNGWWIDLNLSQPQVEARLRRACDVAGLGFGSDLRLDFPSRN